MKRIAEPRPKLAIRDLEVVLALADSGSTVKAAARLHLTQSAVSRALLLAEDKLGTRLFDRTTRGLIATPAGRRLVEGAGAVLAQLAELEGNVRAPAEQRVRLRVVCQCYTAYRWLPSAVANLHRNVASLELSLALEHTRDPIPALLAGDIDIALVTLANVRKPLEQRPLFSDEVIFLVSPTHPLASRATLSPDDLLDYPMLTSTTTPDDERRWFFTQVFGRMPSRVEHMAFPLTEAIIDAARAGMGVAILSEWIADGYLNTGDLVVKRLRGRALRRPWRIAYRREHAAHATKLGALLASAAPHVHAVHA